MWPKDIDPFLDTPEGRAFFPYHRLAPGYRLAPADEAPLRIFLQRLKWVSWASIAAFCFAEVWLDGHIFPAFLAFMALFMSLWFSAVWLRCRHLPRTQVSMPPVHATRKAAATLSSGFIVLVAITCGLAFVSGIVMLAKGLGEAGMNVVCILVFGPVCFWYCRIALIKWTRRAQP